MAGIPAHTSSTNQFEETVQATEQEPIAAPAMAMPMHPARLASRSDSANLHSPLFLSSIHDFLKRPMRGSDALLHLLKPSNRCPVAHECLQLNLALKSLRSRRCHHDLPSHVCLQSRLPLLRVNKCLLHHLCETTPQFSFLADHHSTAEVQALYQSGQVPCLGHGFAQARTPALTDSMHGRYSNLQHYVILGCCLALGRQIAPH
mmetsp:Transcript_47145/g.74501  ORF Transcript_47145/g.74501 Transcript_47145/m.74501 type:complete len:204 (+) Transcript_47145:271-882(+)